MFGLQRDSFNNNKIYHTVGQRELDGSLTGVRKTLLNKFVADIKQTIALKQKQVRLGKPHF